jgi:hypothetical protein
MEPWHDRLRPRTQLLALFGARLIVGIGEAAPFRALREQEVAGSNPDALIAALPQ